MSVSTHTDEYSQALAVFRKQIDCIIRDDREAQMALYAVDLRYEFPFAHDRPRLIEGRDQFRAVMTPLWDEARRRGVNVTGCSTEFHATDEPGLYIAIFSLESAIGERAIMLPFVQLIRVRGDLILEVREYFDPQARAEI
jgi:ketosteroid isomerase-like protein